MTQKKKPPFRADHVGSLLRPARLLQAREDYAAGRIDVEALRQTEDEAIREAVRRQEECGLRAATDGEFRRNDWMFDFLCSFDNVELSRPEGETPHTHITGKLGRSRPIFVEHFRYLKSVSNVEPKITLPSPTHMHSRGRPGVFAEGVYTDLPEFFSDLAKVYREEISDLYDAGCRYLQLDDVNLAFLCDNNHREIIEKNTGESADSLFDKYVKLIDDVIRDRPEDLSVTMHSCRGNFRSKSFASGGYDPVAESIFNNISVDGYFLEYDTESAGGFEPLQFLPKGKNVVLGLVTTKKGELESRDTLKQRLEEASVFAPVEQLALSPQCGFSSTVEGNALTADEQYAKLALIVETASEIWND